LSQETRVYALKKELMAVIVLVIVIIGTIAVFLVVPGLTSKSTSVSTTIDSRLAYLTLSPDYSSFPVMGASNANVTIFQFGDFQCPTCDGWFKNQEPSVVSNLIDTGIAKFVWRDNIFIGPDSTNASIAAYSAGEQGKFWQYYDLLYTNQGIENSGWASSSNLMSFARTLGLNMAEFNQSFTSGQFDSLINYNKAAVAALGISSSPTFFVVGPHDQVQEIAGPQPESVFQTTITSMTS
jgi:protein-disulfide isomerase